MTKDYQFNFYDDGMVIKVPSLQVDAPTIILIERKQSLMSKMISIVRRLAHGS